MVCPDRHGLWSPLRTSGSAESQRPQEPPSSLGLLGFAFTHEQPFVCELHVHYNILCACSVYVALRSEALGL